MSKVIYVEQNGARHEIDLPEGVSVMRGALNNSIPGIDGDCGGECACGTCHVYVDASWLGKLGLVGEMEASMLSFADATQVVYEKYQDYFTAGLVDQIKRS